MARTEDEASAIQVAMETTGLETASWRTVVIAARGMSSALADDPNYDDSAKKTKAAMDQ